MIICDTREKKWEHIEHYFQYHDINYTKKKLDFGDYQIEGKPKLVVDRKRNLTECCQNLCSEDKSRFWREVRGAHAEGIKLVILVEHGSQYKSIKDVTTWSHPYARYTGKWLAEEMYRAHIAYGVEWLFCTKAQTPKRILEILGHDS